MKRSVLTKRIKPRVACRPSQSNGKVLEVGETRNESRVRGTHHQVFEKYMLLAREAKTVGDRVLAESYYQHAEHYLRLINEQKVSSGVPTIHGTSSGVSLQADDRCLTIEDEEEEGCEESIEGAADLAQGEPVAALLSS